ncbi:NnrU family protein [Novosphingobium sp. Gsoil 351]|uniref:NnrU family protein n=1 Tax=Novosphingobium sp. Gsoil 351 TaxID=2675225 RepID=UPI0012B4EE6F|nr:NnrU family protein [Novosphingobium sp. Gsoil 351]QGN55365.1 MFS transporter [Novosphingobium sp. Gsoil 351]
MDPALVSLIAAGIAFVGTHFAMSHPLRAPLVRTLGAAGFAGVYSMVSLATFGWMVWAFVSMPRRGTPLWDGSSEAIWIVASLLSIVALALFIGSLRGNPALPDPRAAQGLADKQPDHVFRVTRHPMMWGFALWALSHILVAPTARTVVLAGAIGFLALVGAHLQDRKKQALMGESWRAWESKTSYWPRLGALPGIGIGLWAVTIALWLAITWAHIWLAYVPAGLWRWVA